MPIRWWSLWYNFCITIGYHSSSMTCEKHPSLQPEGLMIQQRYGESLLYYQLLTCMIRRGFWQSWKRILFRATLSRRRFGGSAGNCFEPSDLFFFRRNWQVSLYWSHCHDLHENGWSQRIGFLTALILAMIYIYIANALLHHRHYFKSVLIIFGHRLGEKRGRHSKLIVLERVFIYVGR